MTDWHATLHLVISVPLAILLVIGLILCWSNRWLPRWACDKMGWHLAPKTQGFDGCSANGHCPRCDKKVMRDSQGNWF